MDFLWKFTQRTISLSGCDTFQFRLDPSLLLVPRYVLGSIWPHRGHTRVIRELYIIISFHMVTAECKQFLIIMLCTHTICVWAYFLSFFSETGSNKIPQGGVRLCLPSSCLSLQSCWNSRPWPPVLATLHGFLCVCLLEIKLKFFKPTYLWICFVYSYPKDCC